MDITTLVPNEKNPRFIKQEKFKKLKESIKESPAFLALRPIIYDPKTMQILGGNMRHRALRDLGYTDIPDDWVRSADELTEEEKQKFVVIDNAPFGEWDWDMLKEWNQEDLARWGLDVKEEDMTQEEMDSAFTNQNCAYPIIPMYDEKYNAIIIICETETEEAAIRTQFNIPEKAKSYKNQFLGRTNVVSAKTLLYGENLSEEV